MPRNALHGPVVPRNDAPRNVFRRTKPPLVPWRTSVLALGLSVAIAACGSGDASTPSPTPGSQGSLDARPLPSDGAGTSPAGQASVPTALAPTVYVGKVKNLLTGLPPLREEIDAVTAQPAALRGLIAQWLRTPEYREKMTLFLAQAFQQTQFDLGDLADQTRFLNAGVDLGDTKDVLLRSLRESFARTAMALMDEGRPFTEVFTTQRFMMNIPLMMFYAYIDGREVDDDGNVTDQNVYPPNGVAFVASPAISLAESLRPTGPNFMRFALPVKPGCEPSLRFQKGTVRGASLELLSYFFGGQVGRVSPECTVESTPHLPEGADAWRMVTIRPPKAQEPTTPFYQLALPNVPPPTTLVLRRPRVGFFTTPAFFANYPTNEANLARVTTNQTLIVALGRGIDPSDPTQPVHKAGIDTEHTAPGTLCYECHRTLDPMKDFFVQSFGFHYGPQKDPAKQAIKPVFAFDGVNQQASGMGAFGSLLSKHPRVAAAWTQKLCSYATSSKCALDHPEVKRIARVFAQRGFKFPVLVEELFSSPLVTYADDASVPEASQVSSIARRDHLCFALSKRLRRPDVCGLQAGSRTNPRIRAATSAIPADPYSRGDPQTLAATDPTLFFRKGVENLCTELAAEAVDAKDPKASAFSSQDIDASLASMVHDFMGLPAPRDGDPLAILHAHYNASRTEGATPTNALRSTFVLACLSPTLTGLGF